MFIYKIWQKVIVILSFGCCWLMRLITCLFYLFGVFFSYSNAMFTARQAFFFFIDMFLNVETAISELVLWLIYGWEFCGWFWIGNELFLFLIFFLFFGRDINKLEQFVWLIFAQKSCLLKHVELFEAQFDGFFFFEVQKYDADLTARSITVHVLCNHSYVNYSLCGDNCYHLFTILLKCHVQFASEDIFSGICSWNWKMI